MLIIFKLPKSISFILLLFIFIVIGCDSGNDRSTEETCEPLEISFSPIPECITDYFLDNQTGCGCESEQFIFGLSLESSDAEGNTGKILSNPITWEASDCTSLSFTGEAEGIIENMVVLEEGILEFTFVLDDGPLDQARCCCGAPVIVE